MGCPESSETSEAAAWAECLEQRLLIRGYPDPAWRKDVAEAAAWYCVRDAADRPLREEEIDQILSRAAAGAGSSPGGRERWNPCFNQLILSGVFQWKGESASGQGLVGCIDLQRLFQAESCPLEIKCLEIFRRICRWIVDAWPEEKSGIVALRGLESLARRTSPRPRRRAAVPPRARAWLDYGREVVRLRLAESGRTLPLEMVQWELAR